MRNEPQPSLIILSDGAKVIDGILIPDERSLRRWMQRHHPEYCEERPQ